MPLPVSSSRTLPRGALPATHWISLLVACVTLAGGTAATAADCERMKDAHQPLHLTVFTLAAADPLKAEDRYFTIDVDRADAETVTTVSHLKGRTMRTVQRRNGMPVSMTIPELGTENRFEYDTDVSAYRLKAGETFSFAARMIPNKGEPSRYLHDYAITDAGPFSVAGCSFDVLAIHHVIRWTQGTTERQTTVDSLYAPDLSVVLRTHTTMSGFDYDITMLVTGIELPAASPTAP